MTLREAGDAHARAVELAPAEGAGTLVWARRYGEAEFALVLEPEEPLSTARRALYAVMNALGDALAGAAPPERPIAFDWPDAIRVDGALVGGCRLAWPGGAPEGEAPPWLVASAVLRLAAVRGPEPGHDPGTTTLAEEGFEAPDAGALVESFARHLMAELHGWREAGFAPVGERWLARLAPGEAGARRGLSVTGDLLLHAKGAARVARVPLLPRLLAPAWPAALPAGGGGRAP